MSPYSSLARFPGPGTGGNQSNEAILYTPTSRGPSARKGFSFDTGDERGSTLAAIANICNACMGAGVVLFPFAISETGIILGPVLALSMMGISLITLRMMSGPMIKTRPKRYEDMVEVFLGAKWRTFFSVTLIFNLWCVMVIYLQLIMDQLKMIMPADKDGVAFWGLDNLGALGAALVFIVPLCLLRNLNILGIPSTISVIAILYICADVVWRGVDCIGTEQGCTPGHAPATFNWKISGIFKAIPVFVGAYQCHFSMPPIYNSLGPSHTGKARINLVALCAYTLCTLTYLPIGVMGYIKYGSATSTDIIANNLCKHTIDPQTLKPKMECAVDAYIAQGFLASACIIGWPLLHFATRLSITAVIFPKKDILKPHHAGKYYTITLTFIAITAVLAYALMAVADSLSMLINYAVALCSVWQVFVIPGMMWNKMHKDDALKKFWGYSVIVIGVVLSVIEVVTTTIQIINPDKVPTPSPSTRPSLPPDL